MPIQRKQTPHPARRPTIPIAAGRVPIHAVPFSPCSGNTPPPSATPTPPPTPLNLPPFTTSFDLLHMFASSSTAPSVAQQVKCSKPTAEDDGPYFLGDLFAEPVDKGKGILGARPASVFPIPKARDIKMVGRASPERRVPPASARSPRSPPSPASPIPAPAPPPPPPAEDNTEGDIPLLPSRIESEDDGDLPYEMSGGDDEEEESVESGDSDDGPEYVEIWVREGDWARAARCAFVNLEPITAAANPAPLIRAAFFRVALHLQFQLAPSHHGVSMMRFASPAAREAAMVLQPIVHEGSTVKLLRVEDTDDRFVREPEWLAHVVCWNYPEEH
ncbi:unnamed protein product [Urochloa humidicola]